MRVALVHDYLKEYGGAERVLEVLAEVFPQAPVYTAFCVSSASAGRAFANKKIITSWANKFLPKAHLYSTLRFLTPLIWESFDFSGFDLVISSASWFITKSIITKPETLHICYCHTPPRWLYGYKTPIEWKRFLPIRIYGEVVGHFLRQYDFLAAQRVDYFIANSQNTKERIAKFYRREATVIYPPVEVEKIINATKNLQPQEYFLVVCRLAGTKGLDLAIEVAKELNINLKIVGEKVGLKWEEEAIDKVKSGNIEFLGRVDDSQLWKLYGEAKALLALSQDEDFGITPVEAMAAGRPVIAFRGGGYVETVVDGVTGEFFDNYSVEALINVLKHFDSKNYNPEDCRKQAEKFDKERFKIEINKFINQKLEEYNAGVARS